MNPLLPSDPELDLSLSLPRACAMTQEALAEAISLEAPLPSEVGLHLRTCPECRAFQSFLPRFHEGLSRLPAPTASTEAIGRVLRAGLADRRLRLRRQVVKAGIGVALAASILIAVFVLVRAETPVRPSMVQLPASPVQADPGTVPQTESTVPAIRDTILEVRSTVVSNLQRTADETLESTLSLLPDPMVVPAADPLQPLEPAVQSLSEVGHGAAVSVRPLTDSARRAVGLIWNELPSLD